MSITTPALGQYRNSEFIRYMKNVIAICGNNNPRTLKIEDQVNGLQAATTPLDDLFMIERGNLLTPELQALDARRDDAITGLRAAANAFAYHFDPVFKNAATVLAAAIDKYGTGLAKLNYVAETEVLESFVGDTSSDATLAAALSTLQLNSWVTELNEANQRFNTTYLSRTNSYASKPDGSLTELRVVTAKAYGDLVAHITAHFTLTPSDSYTKLIGELNSLSEQYNKMVVNRSSGDTTEPDAISVAEVPASES
jgi:Family of unknown function (DUF6261)